MPALNKLKLKRSHCKCVLTQTENYLNNTETPIPTEVLETRKERLISIFYDYEALSLEITFLDPDDAEDQEAYENRYHDLLGQINCLLIQEKSGEEFLKAW